MLVSSSVYAKTFGADVVVGYRGMSRHLYVDNCVHFSILNTRPHLCWIQITAFGSHPDSVACYAVKLKGLNLLLSRVLAKATPAGYRGVSLASNLSEV